MHICRQRRTEGRRVGGECRRPIVTGGNIGKVGQVVDALLVDAWMVMIGGILAGAEDVPREYCCSYGKVVKTYFKWTAVML